MRPETEPLPRELVLASAGSGKTFRISSRFIGLLAREIPPEEILAATFTRKAAGEILDRVLLRLADAALDPSQATALAEDALPGSDPALLGSSQCLQLLRSLVRRLDRVNVDTLDAFFIRTARTFFLELELPPDWRIADVEDSEALEEEAVHQLMADAERGTLVELLRMMNRGEVIRSVRGSLLRSVSDLHRTIQEVAPTARGAWRLGPGNDREEPNSPRRPGRGPSLSERMRSVELPTTASGAPHKLFGKAVESAIAAVEEGQWLDALQKGAGRAVLEGSTSYCRREIPSELVEIFGEVIAEARKTEGFRLDLQLQALERIAALYDAKFRAVQRRAGVYRFEDVTRLLGGEAPMLSRMDLFYRLDARIQHLLLDEFQDTSLAQWRALEPLADELLSGGEGERAAVVVADPKQSIYGWRGAVPDLVRHVGSRYALDEVGLTRSYRSGSVVLNAVNQVFSALDENSVLEDEDPAVIREWMSSFEEHRPAPPLEEEPGFVRLAVGPHDEGRGSLRPCLLARAAEMAAEIAQASPNRTLGILTRTNDAVAFLIHELAIRGLAASEEGGRPLDDAAPVAALLALLRIADHPADRVARYHVARTPVGPVVGYLDEEDDGATDRLSGEIRMELLRRGYGPTIGKWVEALAPDVDARELRRLEQLMEMAHRYDRAAGLRPGAFVERVRRTRVEDPSSSSVRVMTIHQAKGLQFDIVLLPQLDASLLPRGGGPPVLPARADRAGPVTRVFPQMDATLRRLFPEAEAAWNQYRAQCLRDGLSTLYVALTRARHALHMLVPPDGPNGEGSALSSARLIRRALAPDVAAAENDDRLFECGDPEWHLRCPHRSGGQGVEPGSAPVAEPLLPRVELRGARMRNLARARSSDLEGGGRVELARVLDLSRRERRLDGTVVHAWCEMIEWIEEEKLADDELLQAGRKVAPALSEARLSDLLLRFREWIEDPRLRRCFSRGAYPEGARVQREVPVLYRDQSMVVEGIVDRVVWLPEADGRSERAHVLDFKVEAPEGSAAHDERAIHYRPQLDAYRKGVAVLHSIPVERVTASLVFFGSRRVVDLRYPEPSGG